MNKLKYFPNICGVLRMLWGLLYCNQLAPTLTILFTEYTWNKKSSTDITFSRKILQMEKQVIHNICTLAYESAKMNIIQHVVVDNTRRDGDFVSRNYVVWAEPGLLMTFKRSVTSLLEKYSWFQVQYFWEFKATLAVLDLWPQYNNPSFKSGIKAPRSIVPVCPTVSYF